MYKDKTASVVLPSYNEEISFRDCINNFFSTLKICRITLYKKFSY